MNSMQHFRSLFHWRPGLLQTNGEKLGTTETEITKAWRRLHFLFSKHNAATEKQFKSFKESKRLIVECIQWAWNTG